MASQIGCSFDVSVGRIELDATQFLKMRWLRMNEEFVDIRNLKVID